MQLIAAAAIGTIFSLDAFSADARSLFRESV